MPSSIGSTSVAMLLVAAATLSFSLLAIVLTASSELDVTGVESSVTSSEMDVSADSANKVTGSLTVVASLIGSSSTAVFVSTIVVSGN